MKTLYRFLIIILLGFVAYNVQAQDTLYVVEAAAVDGDLDGYYGTVELKFNTGVKDSQIDKNGVENDWQFSLDPGFSTWVDIDEYYTDVTHIANANVADDEYGRFVLNGQLESSDGPIYIRYTLGSANDSIPDAVLTAGVKLENFSLDSAMDYAPPAIHTSSLTQTGGAVLVIDDTIKFEIQLKRAEANVTIFPAKYNEQNLNWSSSDDSVYVGVYVIREFYPDQPNGLDFNDVYIQDTYGNISDSIDFTGIKPINVNAPDVTSVSYSPGDGNTVGIDSTLTVTILAKNAEVNLTCDSATVNGVDVSASFTEVGSGYYTVEYTVTGGDGSIDDNTEATPVNLVLNDGTYITSPVFYDSTITASPGIDDTAPVISSVVLNPSSDTVGIGDTIVFTVNAGEDGLQASTVSINGKDLINEFTAIGSNQYNVEYVIKSGDTDISDASGIPISIILKDESGNQSNNYNTLAAGDCPAIDASLPAITNVSFTPSTGTRAIGQLITITITASENNLLKDSIMVNGKSFAISGTGPTYDINYTIAEGDNDIDDSSVIPVYFSLTDGVNTSISYTTSSLVAGDCPGIDANRPEIVSATFSPGDGNVVGIDSVITVTIESLNAETGLSASTMTVNGIDVSSSFTEVGSGIYTVEYTVTGGDGSINDETEAVSVSLGLNDGTNTTSPLFTGSTILSTPGIDDIAPIISSVTASPVSGMQGIGDTIIFTINAGEVSLEATTISINSKNLINRVTDIGTGLYEVEYVINAGDSRINDASAIPISITMSDVAGNPSNNYTTLLAGNSPGVDATKPVITDVNVTPTDMLYGQTYTINIIVDNDEGDTYTLESGTIVGFDLFNLQRNSSTSYSADFTVGDLGYDVLEGDSYDVLNLVFSDPAGNTSGIYTETIMQAGDPIYTVLPTAKVTGEYHVCELDSAELLFQLTGSAPWNVQLYDGSATVAVNGVSSSPYIHKVEALDINGLVEPDTVVYKITQVTDVNGNIKIMAGTDSAMVFAYEVPVVDITDPPGNKTYNIDAVADTLVGNPVGGVFSGNGIIPSNNTFLASSAGVGTHEIIYEYTVASPAGCFSSDTVEFLVDSSNAVITFDNSDDDWRCDYELTMGITGEVIGKPSIIGDFTLPLAPGAITDHDNNTATVDIQALTDGTYEIEYYYYDGGDVTITRSFTVEDPSSAINYTGLDPEYCEDYDTIFVEAINLTPAGGIGEYFFPEGSTDDYFVNDPNGNNLYFYPDSVDPGSYKLKYIYTTPNGCESDTVKKSFVVNALPTVSFTMNSVYNIDQGASTISGNPLGATGVFTPLSFMSNNGDGTASFDPSDAGLGNHWVTYTYEDVNGCFNSDSLEIEITEALGNISSSKGTFQFCYWGTEIDTLIGTPVPTDGTPGSFYIDNVLITPEADNKIVFNPKDYVAGDHTVRYEYYNGPTLYQVFQTVNVDSVGEVFITDIPDQCVDYDTIFVNAFNLNPTGGTGNYLFSGAGTAFEYDPTDPNNNMGYLLPGEIMPGSYNLKYVYTSPTTGCISDTVQKSFVVNPLPVVSFTMNPTYNIDQPSSTINGNPLGSTGVFTPLTFMSNNGDGTAVFDPADAGIGFHWITYTYEDANTCVNSDSVRIEVNQALGSIASSSGTFNFCYFGGSIDTLIGTPIPTDGTPGSFYIDDVLITPESDNRILINPQDYAAGDHTVKFVYNNGAAPYEVFTTINIDSIGDIYFTGLDESYCESEDIEIELTAFYTGEIGTMDFTGNGITDDVEDNLGYFNPSEANLEYNSITYTFIRDYSGCQRVYNEVVKINKTPTVAFYPNEKCIPGSNSLLGFTSDTLMSDSIVIWDWTYGNSTSSNSSAIFEVDPGFNTLNLELESIHGCVNDIDSIFFLGTRVNLEFTFENECHGETVLFELLTTSDPDDTLSTNWNFGGAGIADLTDRNNPEFTYDSPGAYDVIYEEVLKTCGRIADTIRLNIRPSVDLSMSYLEDFEDSPDMTGWVIEDYEEGANNTWQWGEPSGTKINSAASGSNAFVTNLTGEYANSEKGMITSPCFDFSSMERPMMKMDYISYTETDRDGAVIQYAKSDGTWATIGVPSDGINWYTSYIISGAPADQQLGWTGNIVDTHNNGWNTAMFRLDELRGRGGVRFRIVFGSNGDFTDEGFAFDNIQFKERERIVLLENFTNITDEDANNIQDNTITPIVEKDSLDVICLNYHTSFPASNSFNSYYPSGPSARALFYGVSDVPHSTVDGQGQFDYSIGNELTQSDIHKRVLVDPAFSISLKQDIQNDKLVVSSDVKALEDISGQDLIVYIAVVERTVEENSEKYNNVLRTMLPDAAGTLIERDWLTNDSVNIYQTWPLPTDVRSDSLITIVFVQDEETKEIYQVNYTDDFLTITSVNELVENIARHDYRIYPNPVKEVLTLQLLKTVPYDMEINIYNGVGALVKNALIGKGESLIEINTNDLPTGVYYVRLSSSNKVIDTRKIIKID